MKEKIKRARDDEESKKEVKEEMKEEMILLENVSNQQNPPDEFAQNVSKKFPSDEFFVRKFRILPVFSIIYMIRIRFSAPGNKFRMHFGVSSIEALEFRMLLGPTPRD